MPPVCYNNAFSLLLRPEKRLNFFFPARCRALGEEGLAAASAAEGGVEALDEIAEVSVLLTEGLFPRAVRAREYRAAAAAGVHHRVTELAHAVRGHILLKEQHVALTGQPRRHLSEYLPLQPG